MACHRPCILLEPVCCMSSRMARAAKESRTSSFQSSPRCCLLCLVPEGMANCCCLPSQMSGWLGILVSRHLMETGYHQVQPSVTALQTGKQPQEVESLCTKSTGTSLWSEEVIWEDLLHRSTCSLSSCY
uniref:Uncharacterized protein n=1 Tax=Myotis myotis TaxID=51298 RepID=A0A7J7UCZ4_MYOMY|nr:hypothetical protein mMyoMyo1_008787 [Myotis myotis]